MLAMHLVLALVVGLRTKLSKVMNEGAWLLKLALLGAAGLLWVYAVGDGIIDALQMVTIYMLPIWYLFQVIPTPIRRP